MAGPVSITPKGIALGRYIKSLAIARGDVMAAAAYAAGQGWRDTPSVAESLQKAIDPLAAGNNDQGAVLVAYPIAVDFASLLRAATIMGRMSGFRAVPFDVRMLAASAGTVANWRGEANPIPASAMDFAAGTTLGFASIDSMSIITKELSRHSAPGVEMILATDMIRAAVLVADSAFVDPENAGSAGVRPAAVTYGAPTVPSTGNSVAQVDADLRGAVEAVGDADLATAYWVMRPKTALFLATLRGSGGALAHPGITARGGTLLGLPVLTSNAVVEDADSPGETYIALVVADQIAVADDGDSAIAYSEQAALQMVDNPSGGPQQMISLWQNGLVGIRASRKINWQARTAYAAAVIDGVTY